MEPYLCDLGRSAKFHSQEGILIVFHRISGLPWGDYIKFKLSLGKDSLHNITHQRGT